MTTIVSDPVYVTLYLARLDGLISWSWALESCGLVASTRRPRGRGSGGEGGAAAVVETSEEGTRGAYPYAIHGAC